MYFETVGLSHCRPGFDFCDSKAPGSTIKHIFVSRHLQKSRKHLYSNKLNPEGLTKKPAADFSSCSLHLLSQPALLLLKQAAAGSVHISPPSELTA